MGLGDSSGEGRPRFFQLAFRNWISLAGAVVALASFFAFLFLFAIDLFAPSRNPYMGILAYLVAPGFTCIGAVLIVAGILINRRQIRTKTAAAFTVDLSRPRDRRNLVFFVGGSVFFLLITAIGSYQSYHFTESVEFCGKACHTVMEPEYTTYLHSPHARVACAECHIGPGADWYVKSKLSGAYQVYSTIFKKYHTPIEPPVKNLRPAQETCEQCHWPEKFVGNLDVTFARFLADETNTPYSVRMLLKVGGGDPKHGPVGGIHWHMTIANKVEYGASDPKRQVIPWVRVTNQKGEVTEYRTPDFKGDASKLEVRTMDCMDCHNRPTHIFHSPSAALDLSLSLGRIDRSMPGIKKAGIELLTQKYASADEALQKIHEGIRKRYPGDARADHAAEEIQHIYRDNFFPIMKSDWRVYPNNIGHMEWAGCFRCHDGEHRSADGKKAIGSDCNACHTILAQGSGEELAKLSPHGQEFKHPGGDMGEAKCHECHTGE